MNRMKSFICKIYGRGGKVDGAFADKISRSDYNNVQLVFNGVPVPPIMMRDKVRRSAVLAEDFIIEGQQVFNEIRSFLKKNKASWHSKSSVYEFGVGCGRLARFFLEEELAYFSGSDVDKSLISFCKNHLAPLDKRFSFFENPYFPPSPIKAESFDIIYSISVFTHMEKETQQAWFEEMSRLLKPGGYFLLSIIENKNTAVEEDVVVRERIDIEYRRDWFGVDGAPDTYFSTANSLNYVINSLKNEFSFVDYREKAVRGRQGLILFQKKLDEFGDK